MTPAASTLTDPSGPCGKPAVGTARSSGGGSGGGPGGGCASDLGADNPGLARKGVAVLAARVVGLACGLGGAVLMGRLLGPGGYGVYEVVLAWLAMLHIPAVMGAETLVLRGVSRRLSAGRGVRAEAIAAAALRFTMVTALALGVAVALVGLLWGPGSAGPALAWLLPLLPAHCALRVLVARVQGGGAPVRGILPETLWAPAALLLMVIGWWVVVDVGGVQWAATPHTALLLHWIAFGIAVAIVWRARNQLVHRTEVLGGVPSGPATGFARGGLHGFSRWGRCAMPLVVLGLLEVGVHRLDLLVLDAMAEPEVTGGYAAARRLATLVSLGLMAATVALAPRVAALHRKGDRVALQAAVTATTRFATLLGAMAAVALWVAPGWWLGWLGEGFVVAGSSMNWLVLGHLLNVACGPVAILLLMTGGEGRVLRGYGLGCVVQLVLLLLLVPGHGAIGAALASAGGMAVWNGCLLVEVFRMLGIRADLLAPTGR